jgi:hypothetical protein
VTFQTLRGPQREDEDMHTVVVHELFCLGPVGTCQETGAGLSVIVAERDYDNKIKVGKAKYAASQR